MTYYVRKLPSDVFGFEYRPTLEPTLSDTRDHFMELGFFRRPPTTFTVKNADILREVLRINRENIHCIMEIGVSRDGPGCTTDIFFGEKAPSCIYLGVDIIAVRSDALDLRNFVFGAKSCAQICLVSI